MAVIPTSCLPTCSTSCPKIAAQFFRMQKKVNYIKSFTVVSHTVYPEKETPEVLSQYARLVHADPNYCNFFTGNRKDLETVARDGYELNIDSTVGLVHQSSLYLVDKNKHIRGIYDGTSTTDVNRLIDVQAAIRPPAKGMQDVVSVLGPESR